MKVAVAGGLGFIGRHIIEKLKDEGYDVTLIARGKGPYPEGVTVVKGDLMQGGDWQKEIADNDVVINLVGVNLFQRWSPEIKKLIYDSRINSTSNIIASFGANARGKVLINASAVGYYGSTGDTKITEESPAGNDFLAEVCRDWEAEALKGETAGMRVVLLRFGSVFGHDGGAFPPLLKSFRFCMGSRLGNGKQWFPWLHVDDAAGIALKAIKDKKMSGAYNCTAPGMVTNGDLTRIIAALVKRPVIIPFVPVFVLRVLFGEFGKFLTRGQKAQPARLAEAGYSFLYPGLKEAVADLIMKQSLK